MSVKPSPIEASEHSRLLGKRIVFAEFKQPIRILYEGTPQVWLVVFVDWVAPFFCPNILIGDVL